ncbi:MAG: hypothetical protein YK1309IOTA_340003 [Marine Group I thaumarchaeote]|nr:MAG: hypothetical protein YK1309IOTA_340003 [Marine Group I thaumarchaeote]
MNIVFDSNLVFQNKKEYQNMIDSNKVLEAEPYIKNITHAYNLLEDNTIGVEPIFVEAFTQGKSLEPFLKKDRVLFTHLPLQIKYDNNYPSVASSEVVEFLNENKNSSRTTKLSFLINRIIRKNYVIIEEIHPTHKELIDKLVKLRNSYPDDYKELQDVFQDLTNGIQLQVAKRTPLGELSTDEFILFKEKKRTFSIQESASGHYALIHILHSILNKPNQVIVIDEPEVHFHPIMITQLNERLNELAIERNNQIVIISHSPKFVNFDLLDSAQNSRLTLILRQNDNSEVNSAPESFHPSLKRHLFNPEIFFGKCTLIVEGSGDYFAMKAISDFLQGILEKYNITLTHCWGKGNVPAVMEIHDAFKIPYVAMVDDDYSGTMTSDVVKLPKQLEDEYQTLGWSPRKKIKDDAYPFMENLLQNGGLTKLKQSAIWIAFEQIIKKVGGTIPE